jgi:poly(beta-D-mannuronate) lyase
MAWGALAGDDAYFREGPAAFDMALADMRPDGSLPLETRRGSRALWYQRHAIASLVAIAEMGAVQGRTSTPASGTDGACTPRSASSSTRSTMPGLVRRYADRGDEDPAAGAEEEPDGPGPGLPRPPRPRPALHGLGRGLRRALPRGATRADDCCGCCATPSPDFRPMLDDYSGGSMSCLFATPERSDATAPP